METSRIKLSPDWPIDTSVEPIPVARAVRSAVLGSKGRFWRSDDFDGSPKAVEHALSRLEAAGELIHVRRGLYWRGNKTAFGMSPPSTLDLAVAVVNAPGVGPSGWSATNALGLATQIPGREAVAVPTRAPSGLKGVRWVSRNARWARREERLTATEVAILEALEGFEHYVELPADKAVARLLEILLSDEVRPERLALASRTEPARTRRRLSDLLTRAGLGALADRVPKVRTATSIPALAV